MSIFCTPYLRVGGTSLTNTRILLIFYSIKYTKAAWLSRKVTDTQLGYFAAKLSHAFTFIKYKFTFKELNYTAF